MFLESLDLTCMCFFSFSFFFCFATHFYFLFFIFGVCWLFTLTRILVRTYCDHEQKLNKTIDSAADIDTSAVFFLFEDAKSHGSLSAALNWKKKASRQAILGIFTTSILTIPPISHPTTCVQRYMPLLMFSHLILPFCEVFDYVVKCSPICQWIISAIYTVGFWFLAKLNGVYSKISQNSDQSKYWDVQTAVEDLKI